MTPKSDFHHAVLKRDHNRCILSGRQAVLEAAHVYPLNVCSFFDSFTRFTLSLLQEDRDTEFRPIAERNNMYWELFDIKNEITLYEPFHILFDAGLWYIQPHSHEVVAMGALQSIHNETASSILAFEEQKHAVTVYDPISFPPDDLLAVQKEYCLKQSAIRAADYIKRPFYCPHCGLRYVRQNKLSTHMKKCDAELVSPAHAFTPQRYAAAGAPSASSPSIPTPVSSPFDLSQMIATVNEIPETKTQDSEDEADSEDEPAPSSGTRQCVCFGRDGCRCIKRGRKQCKCLRCVCYFASRCVP